MSIKLNGKDVIPKINGVNLSRVMYNGKQIYPANNNVIEIQLANVVAGDICVFDGTNKRFFRFIDSGATDDIKKYTPIGIVVIPASHNVYGDGSCGVMCLVAMSCNNPSVGTTISEPSMYWGEYGTDISSLTNYNVVCHIGNNGNPQSTIQGTTGNAYLPSDKFDTVQCPHDTDAYYYYNDSDYYIPSPYLTNGERNPLYYQTTSPSSANNAMSDFDGKNNTQKIITQRGIKDYDSWTPDNTTETDYPAASCCDMFYTIGTSQGDWYLPACGELGYIMPSLNKINQAISQLRKVYGTSVGVGLIINSGYWSSTEYSSNSARRVYTSNGSIYGYGKNGSYYVRAFLKVSP